jgi:hypothetical protein
MALVKEVSVIGWSPCIARERWRVAPADNPRALTGDTIVQTVVPQVKNSNFAQLVKIWAKLLYGRTGGLGSARHCVRETAAKPRPA